MDYKSVIDEMMELAKQSKENKKIVCEELQEALRKQRERMNKQDRDMAHIRGKCLYGVPTLR